MAVAVTGGKEIFLASVGHDSLGHPGGPNKDAE